MRNKLVLAFFASAMVLMYGCGASQSSGDVVENSPSVEENVTEAVAHSETTSEESVEAATEASTVEETEPSDEELAKAMLTEASELASSGDTDGAIAKYEEATGNALTEGEAFLALGKIYEDAKEYRKAFDAYGHAYWAGVDSASDKVNEIVSNLEDATFVEYTKYAKRLPRTQDSEQTNHIRLADGTIVENGGSIKASDLDGAVFVFNDMDLKEGDYMLVTIGSMGAYYVDEDPEPNWAYDTIAEKGREVDLEWVVGIVKEENYDDIYVGYIYREDYNNGKYDDDVELNFAVE